MADVLEDEIYFWQPDLCTQQIVVIVLELRIREMIPPRDIVSVKIK